MLLTTCYLSTLFICLLLLMTHIVCVDIDLINNYTVLTTVCQTIVKAANLQSLNVHENHIR